MSSARAILDIAPQPQIATLLLGLIDQDRYVAVDLAPRDDITTRADLTLLPFGDAAFDLIVCYHVLEHVPDDAAAMGEVARVLSPGGVALIQVPRRSGRPTDEDPSAPTDERVRRFGQADHVRWYGDDFESRLIASGLRPYVIRPTNVLQPRQVEWMGISDVEQVWICRSFAHDERLGRPPWRGDGPIGLPRAPRMPGVAPIAAPSRRPLRRRWHAAATGLAVLAGACTSPDAGPPSASSEASSPSTSAPSSPASATTTTPTPRVTPTSESSPPPAVAMIAIAEYVQRWNEVVAEPDLRFEAPPLQPVEEDPGQESFLVQLQADVNLSVVVKRGTRPVHAAILGFPTDYRAEDVLHRESLIAFVLAIDPSLTRGEGERIAADFEASAERGAPAQLSQHGISYVFRRTEGVAFAIAGPARSGAADGGS